MNFQFLNIFKKNDSFTTFAGLNGGPPILMKNHYGKYNETESYDFVRQHVAFNNWYERTKENFRGQFKSVQILEITPFGKIVNNKGFIYINAQVVNDKELPGIALIRGNSVAALVLLVNELDHDDVYVLTVIQPRVPGGVTEYEEMISGMTDGDTFQSALQKEVYEETCSNGKSDGIDLSKHKCEQLGTIHPSIGGCDEMVQLSLITINCSVEQIREYEGKFTGNVEESETIKLKVRRLKEFICEVQRDLISDAKIKSALFHYMMEYHTISGGKKRKRVSLFK